MPKAYLIDMDGVLVRGSRVIPGASEFLKRLHTEETPFLILTNNSRFTPRDQQARLRAMGLEIPAESILPQHWLPPGFSNSNARIVPPMLSANLA